MVFLSPFQVIGFSVLRSLPVRWHTHPQISEISKKKKTTFTIFQHNSYCHRVLPVPDASASVERRALRVFAVFQKSIRYPPRRFSGTHHTPGTHSPCTVLRGRVGSDSNFFLIYNFLFFTSTLLRKKKKQRTKTKTDVSDSVSPTGSYRARTRPRTLVGRAPRATRNGGGFLATETTTRAVPGRTVAAPHDPNKLAGRSVCRRGFSRRSARGEYTVTTVVRRPGGMEKP